jgi:galactokinase
MDEQILDTLRASFQERFGKPPVYGVQAPGRVNLLGEHVDYNEGPVLPAAIDRSVKILAAPSGDDTVTLHALDMKAHVTFDLSNLEAKVDVTGKPLPGWARYPASAAWAIQESGREVRGVQAVYTSNVPIGSGLSSSAAVEVGFAVLWQALGGWEADRMTLARLCQRGENAYVGVASGLMDQFASAHGVQGHALYFDTRSLEWSPEPLPAGVALVIADSGGRRSLTTSDYNDRRQACEKAVEILRQYMPQIHSLRDVSTTEFAAYSVMLPEVIRKRAEHVVKEIARVRSAVTALERNDKQAFGALMYAGHASLRDLYEVSTPELDALVAIARGLPGCIGARLTGAGFGGCTINLVEEEQAEEFIQALTAEYRQKTGGEAQVYLCQASEGAKIQSL